MSNFDFRPLIRNAAQAINNFSALGYSASDQRSQFADLIQGIITPLISALQLHPFEKGAADTVALISKLYMAIPDHYHTAVTSLLVHRLKGTLINPLLHFESLVNLAGACICLKSFEEAYFFGSVAEKINDDEDLLAYMTIASHLSDRKDESERRFDRLKQLSPRRATKVHAYTKWKSDLKPTSHLSCDDLVKKFEALKFSIDSEKLETNLSDLQERPDGKNAWKCWRILCEVFVDMMKNSYHTSEFLRLQKIVGLAAASGKALAFHPDKARDDKQLRKWNRDALSELGFDDIQL